MKKRVLLYVLASTLFLGCTPYKTYDNNAPVVQLRVYGPYTQKNMNYKEYGVVIDKMPKTDASPALHVATLTAYALLEATAREVLKKKNTHFSITYPKNLSPSQGRHIYDLKTFQDECIGFFSNHKSCGLTKPKGNYYGITSRNNTGSLYYRMYTQAPKNSLTWDAKKLLHALKKEGLLVPKSFDWMELNSKKLVYKETFL